MDEHKHLHHLKGMVVCFSGLQPRCVHTYVAKWREKDPGHHGDGCLHYNTWIHSWAWREQQGAACKPDRACEPNSGHVQSCRCSIHFSLLPCITAITEQQAILAVTSATHLTEGWIILSISTLSFRVLNRNLNKTGIDSSSRTWHFLKSIITLTVVPAVKSKSEGVKMAEPSLSSFSTPRARSNAWQHLLNLATVRHQWL